MSKHDEDELKKVRITVDELRKFKGFESLSDEKAEEVIEMLLKFSILCYNQINSMSIEELKKI